MRQSGTLAFKAGLSQDLESISRWIFYYVQFVNPNQYLASSAGEAKGYTEIVPALPYLCTILYILAYIYNLVFNLIFVQVIKMLINSSNFTLYLLFSLTPMWVDRQRLNNKINNNNLLFTDMTVEPMNTVCW